MTNLINSTEPNPQIEEPVSDWTDFCDMLITVQQEIEDHDAGCSRLSIEDRKLVEICLLGVQAETDILHCELFADADQDNVPDGSIIVRDSDEHPDGLTTILYADFRSKSVDQLEQRKPIFVRIAKQKHKPVSEQAYLCSVAGNLFGLICSISDRILNREIPFKDMTIDDWSCVNCALSEANSKADDLYHNLFETFDSSEPTDPALVVVEYGEGGDPCRDAVRLSVLALEE